MSYDEKVIRKIKLLLNKTQNNPSKEEAQSALLMAQKIMAQYGIEESSIDFVAGQGMEQTSKKEVVHEGVTDYCRLAWWHTQLGQVIAKNFRCHLYINVWSGRGKKLMFLGLKQDTQLAKMVFEFAKESIEYHCESFLRVYKDFVYNSPSEKREFINGAKNDFLTGWIRGLKEQYEEQVKNNDWGLVLVKDALVTQEVNKMNFTSSRSSSHARSMDNNAYSQGYRQGKSFSSSAGRLN